jgi:hypothetical protein
MLASELLTTAVHTHTATTEAALRLTIALLAVVLLAKALLLLLRRTPDNCQSMDRKLSPGRYKCIHILLSVLLVTVVKHLLLDLVNETHYCRCVISLTDVVVFELICRCIGSSLRSIVELIQIDDI